MNFKKIFPILLLCLGTTLSHAFEQKEIAVRSNSMNKDVLVTVITPDGYSTEQSYPTIYLLHGYGGNHTVWAQDGVVGRLADQYNVLVVMPDGARNSWYFDSLVSPDYYYETFVAKELVAHIDTVYSTIQDRSARAITGLSMGGHGAFYLAMRHQDTFGNMGSMSGGLDFRPFTKNWNIAGRLGTYEENPKLWDENTVINLTHLLKPGAMNIIFDCGTEDFFYKVNCNMHAKLLQEKIPHEFHSRPGSHDWPYWLNAVKYQFLFFADRFKR